MTTTTLGRLSIQDADLVSAFQKTLLAKEGFYELRRRNKLRDLRLMNAEIQNLMDTVPDMPQDDLAKDLNERKNTYQTAAEVDRLSSIVDEAKRRRSTPNDEILAGIRASWTDLVNLLDPGVQTVMEEAVAAHVMSGHDLPPDGPLKLLPSMHFVITGAPGTGKTTLAKKIAKFMSAIGYLVFDDCIVVGKQDFIAGYIGQSAPLSRKTLMRSLESALMIDEAHSLTIKDSDGEYNSYSREAISEIVRFMTEFHGQNVLIAAGYTDRMKDDFIPADEGFERRWSFVLHLREVSTELLVTHFKEYMTKKTKQAGKLLRLCDYVNESSMNNALLALTNAISAGDGARRLVRFGYGSIEILADKIFRTMSADALRKCAKGVDEYLAAIIHDGAPSPMDDQRSESLAAGHRSLVQSLLTRG